MKQENQKICDELKRCPICGIGIGKVNVSREGYYVRCQHCGTVVDDVWKSDATGSFEGFDTKQEAIAAWNNLA